MLSALSQRPAQRALVIEAAIVGAIFQPAARSVEEEADPGSHSHSEAELREESDV